MNAHGAWMPLMRAAEAEPILAALFGPEPRGVLARNTGHVMKVCAMLRDKEAVDTRASRAMMDAK